MILLNFSHPLTETQCIQIESLTGEKISEVRHIPAQFDHASPFDEQIRALIDEIGLTFKEWQILPILINPPSYNFAALTLLAEVHGRMGYFPTIVRIRPIEGSTPTQYEVAEIINLQSMRDKARKVK